MKNEATLKHKELKTKTFDKKEATTNMQGDKSKLN
jgi:hypothetical protein